MTRRSRRSAVLLWLLALAMLVVLRYRGRIGLVRGYHAWLTGRNVPLWVRSLDGHLILLLFGVGLWACMATGTRSRSEGLIADLGLRGGVLRGGCVGLVIALPMLLLGALAGRASLAWPMVSLVGTGPLVEEWFFRGALVLAFVRLIGVRF